MTRQLPIFDSEWDQPLIVEVARYRLDDGPGIRSVVFLKGCGLRCSFCQNPEAQAFHAEVVATPARCVKCEACVTACPKGIALPASSGPVRPALCAHCGACAAACPSGALRTVGTRRRPEELAELLLRDRAYYTTSRGGVTFSGGEPALFPQFLGELGSLLKRERVHLLLETGGHFGDYETFRDRVLPHLDIVDFSLKLADAAAHRLMAGQDNRLILKNLERLAAEPRVTLQVSIPLVRGLTASAENLGALVDILRALRIRSVRLLPYNPLGVLYAQARGKASPCLPTAFMSPRELDQITELFHGLLARPSA